MKDQGVDHEMLLSYHCLHFRCQFNGEKCGPENFTTIVTNYGVCYTFNSFSMGKSKEVRAAGKTSLYSIFYAVIWLMHCVMSRTV